MVETSTRVRHKETSRGPQPSALALHLVRSTDPRLEWSDAEVVAGLRRGELRAQRIAWERYAPTVYRLSQRALGSTEDARDATQDVLACVFAKAAKIEKPEALKAFVMSVMIRTLKYELRRRRMRRWLVLSDTGQPPEAVTLAPDHASRQLLRRFYAILDTLSAPARLVFVLRHIEGLTLDEVAEAMALSLATVKRRLSAATERLSALLEREPELARAMGRWGGGDHD
jgi:RNA polymerase sigma-70 factor (ECF subfamily)